MKSILRLIILACLLSAFTSASAAAERQRLSFVVIGSDKELDKRLEDGISARLLKANIEISDKLPQGKLFLYASQDVNDRKNTKGVSFAIAHTSNVQVALLLLDALKRKEEPSEMLMSMAREEGFIKYLSVAHIDEASKSEINELLDSVVKTFLEKYPPPNGG